MCNSKKAAPQVECEPVATIVKDKMFPVSFTAPIIDWHKDIMSFDIGTKLYTTPPDAQAKITELEKERNRLDFINKTLKSNIDDQSKSIAELEAKNAELIEALEWSFKNIDSTTVIHESKRYADTYALLAEMKKGE